MVKMRKYFLLFGFIGLLTSCSLLNRGVQVDNKYQNENSKVISLLVSEKELSTASNDFVWESIRSEQEQSSQNYELASRMYRGYYQTSDNNITIWHTVRTYNQPINISNLPSLEFGVSVEDITSIFSPKIETVSPVTTQCIVYRKVGQVCKVNIVYSHTESDLYLSTAKYYPEETLSAWLNSIVISVESRILAQDTLE
jgi:hypothetical protein